MYELKQPDGATTYWWSNIAVNQELEKLIVELSKLPLSYFTVCVLLNPEFHWLRQIANTLRKFHWWFWIFLDAIAKAKILICKSIAQTLKRVSLTKTFFSFGKTFSYLLYWMFYEDKMKIKKLVGGIWEKDCLKYENVWCYAAWLPL